MSIFEEQIETVAGLALSYGAQSFAVFKMSCKYFSGLVEGPECRWLDVNGEEAGWDNKIIREISTVYHKSMHDVMLSKFKAGEANNLELTIWLNGDSEIRIFLDEHQESQYQAELREFLGDEEYDRLDEAQPADNEDASKTLDTGSDSVTEEYTAQDLYTHLYHTVTADLPENWKSVTIRFSVSTDGNYKNLEANYLFEDASSASHTFEPTETFGPLNAMDKLRELNDEEPWQSATFYLYPGGQIGFKASDDV